VAAWQVEQEKHDTALSTKIKHFLVLHRLVQYFWIFMP